MSMEGVVYTSELEEDHTVFVIKKNGKPLVAVFIHSRGPGILASSGVSVRSLGGCRKWTYEDTSGMSADEAAYSDGRKLSRGMSHKAWMARLRLGGGKSVIFEHNLEECGVSLSELWPMFGELIRSIGYYHTAEDAGTTPEMMAELAKYAPEGLVGGAKEHDPSPWTALGVYRALNTAVRYAFPGKRIKDLSFAIQGLGNVGSVVAETLKDHGVCDMYIADTIYDRVCSVHHEVPTAIKSTPDEILYKDVDVLMPCALGGCITEENVSRINASLVLGCANNQLATRGAGVLMHKHGIWYAPDFVVNAGGLLAVVELDLLRHDSEALDTRLDIISENVKTVLDCSLKTGRASSEVAIAIAKERGEAMCASA